MAGVTVGGAKYNLNGFYGTAEEHAARQKASRTQAPYGAAGPSAGAASGAYSNVHNKGLDINVDPTGNTSLSNQSQQQRQMLELQAKLKAADDDKKRQQQLQDRASLLLKMNGPAAASPTVQHPGGNPGLEQDARSAAFSRAKDQAGALARASLTAISEQMAGRGMSGSGLEALRQAGAVDDTAGSLLNVVRDQTMSDAARAASISDQTYQGGIAQRGQDMSNRQSYLSLLRSLY